jgi:transcriptional regulator with XRE-family HTH domain
MTGAEAIREARVKAGLTQAQLAELLGRDRAQVARWEIRGQEPSFENVMTAVEACGYTLTLEKVEHPDEPELDIELEASIDRAPQQRVQALIEGLRHER